MDALNYIIISVISFVLGVSFAFVIFNLILNRILTAVYKVSDSYNSDSSLNSFIDSVKVEKIENTYYARFKHDDKFIAQSTDLKELAELLREFYDKEYLLNGLQSKN